jgi:hypothetical protein
MVGNKVPDKNETGNIKAAPRMAICHQEAKLKAPARVPIASPGKHRYDKSTAIAARSNNAETK